MSPAPAPSGGALVDRLVGLRLHDARQKADYTGIALAARIGWSTSKISRLESGSRTATEAMVRTLLAHCAVTDSAADAVVQLLGYRDCGYLPLWRTEAPLSLAEALVNSVHTIAPLVVPELLQTPDYTHWLLAARGVPAERRATALAELALRRDTVFCPRRQVRCRFLITEAALHPAGAPRSVLHEQMLHLVMRNAHDNIHIQILPPGPAAAASPFTLYDFHTHPVACLPTPNGPLLIEHPTDLPAYHATWAHLTEQALDPRHSSELLMSAATDNDTQPPQPDGHTSTDTT